MHWWEVQIARKFCTPTVSIDNYTIAEVPFDIHDMVSLHQGLHHKKLLKLSNVLDRTGGSAVSSSVSLLQRTTPWPNALVRTMQQVLLRATASVSLVIDA